MDNYVLEQVIANVVACKPLGLGAGLDLRDMGTQVQLQLVLPVDTTGFTPAGAGSRI